MFTKKKYVHNDKEVAPITILNEDTEFEGELTFSQPLQIKGKLKGKIKSNSFLFISKSSKIEANIEAKVVVVEGEVKGDIKGLDKVEIVYSGKVFGDITTAKLKIDDGAIFEGSCKMLK